VTLSDQIKTRASDLGFSKCGITRAEPLDLISRQRFLNWLENNLHGEMGYLNRAPEKRTDPRRVLDHASSIISVLINYYSPEKHSTNQQTGVISRYAWGRDYHLLVKQKLRDLDEFLSSLTTHHSSLFYVDTGPVLDKWWAERAGLGWIGKNTNLITREMGSWVFVGEILTTLKFEESEYDLPFEHPLQGSSTTSHHPKKASGSQLLKTPARETRKTFCGSCSQCLKVCPTRAIVAPYIVDARRCISYLTIELRGPIPRELRPLIGNRVFGCDDCQDVCPWNLFAVPTRQSDFQPADGNLAPQLAPLLSMSREEFNLRFKESPIQRARYTGFLRNVAVALGNSHSTTALPALIRALTHPDALVRRHAAWAIRELGTEEALRALQDHQPREKHLDVLEEIKWALSPGYEARSGDRR